MHNECMLILTRISEILIAVFKGIDKGNGEKEQVNRQEKELIRKKAKLEGAETLTSILAEAKKEKVSSSLLQTIEDGIRKLEKM